MSMRLYDTSKQDVVPFEPGPLVSMYTCGITPYDSTHLGHASTYVFYDVLQRRLIDKGHTVRCVRNVTDVDDPLFAKARELGIHYLDLATTDLEPGGEIRFTFYWPEANRWEGKDFTVRVVAPETPHE